MEIDGHVALLNKIFGGRVVVGLRADTRLFCRECDLVIDSPIKGIGNLCVDCYRIKNNERARWHYLQNPDYHKAMTRRYAKDNPAKVRAWGTAKFKYRETLPCIVDGCETLGVRHHPDYSKPTEIVWLCPLHHKAVHRGEMVV